jgi:sec-independent protein translocase protein TatA
MGFAYLFILLVYIKGDVMFGGISIWELSIILVIVLIIFGAGKLPEIGSGIGKAIKNFKSATTDSEKKDQDSIEEDKKN